MSDHRKGLWGGERVPEIEESGVTRRRFLVEAGGIGLTAAVSLGLPAIGKAKIEFIQSSCGEAEKVKAKILVAYASRCGSTGGVADAIGKQLCLAGAAVDVRLVKQATDLSSYDAVIVGSPAQSERWLPEARRFVDDNKDTLSRLPVAYFVTCLKTAPGQPSLSLRGPEPKDEPVEKKRLKVKAYLDPLLKNVPQVKPVDIAVFSGALDYSKLTPAGKAMLKSNGFIEGDFRDWEMIRGWAKGIAPALLKA